MHDSSGRIPLHDSASAQALVWLRDSLGYTQEKIIELTRIRSYRSYEYGARITPQIFKKLVAGLSLPQEIASALADAAGLRPPTMDCQTVPDRLLPDLQATVDDHPCPCYITNPWWEVIASNAIGGRWLSPLLNPGFPQGPGRNALNLVFGEADRLFDVEKDPYLDSFIAAYKASMLRHWRHAWCRPRFEEVVDYMYGISPYWAQRWNLVAARDRDHAWSTWLISGTWDSNPADPWHDPEFELRYMIRTVVAEPCLAAPRTDYRINTILVPQGNPPTPTQKIPRRGYSPPASAGL